MNWVYLFIEMLLVFSSLILFYKIGKKDWMYLYIALMSSILCAIIIGTIDVMSFQVNLGIPIIMGLFVSNNVIIHRYGIDEVKRILLTFSFAYLITIIMLNFISLIGEVYLEETETGLYNLLFDYSFGNLRSVISGFISVGIMLWISSGIYYSVKKSENIIFVSNIVVTFVVSFVESFIFILLSYIGTFDVINLIAMFSIRYIIEVILGIVGLLPVYILIKFIDK